MRGDRLTRVLSIAALAVAVVALVVAVRSHNLQQDHERQMEALGELIRRASAAGRPIMEMGPPGGGLPELDRGE